MKPSRPSLLLFRAPYDECLVVQPSSKSVRTSTGTTDPLDPYSRATLTTAGPDVRLSVSSLKGYVRLDKLEHGFLKDRQIYWKDADQRQLDASE